MGIRLVHAEISILGDLLLFNLVALATALSILMAKESHRITRIPIALAIFAWTIGSTASSWNALQSSRLPDWISDAGYLAFYPLLFFGLMSTLRSPRETNRLHLLDSVIIAVGLSSLLSILALTATSADLTLSSYEVILKNFYPIADALLVATAVVIIIRSGWDRRNLLTLIALVAFTLTDILFLVQSAEGSYRFGSMIDSGWLVALLLIAESQWQRQSERIKSGNHPLLATMVAALGSTLVIVMEVIWPDEIPEAAMIPAFLTLTLAFVRMALAVVEAQRLNEVTILARTDELTGLANRRRFIEELKLVAAGDAVILIDLNGFKPINDTYGHGAGDELLRQSALRLARTFDREWIFARLGGDEFGLLVKADPTEGKPQVHEIARSVAASFSYPFTLSGIGEVSISAAVGVAIEDGSGAPLKHADLAMYHAKRRGEAIAFWSELAGDATSVPSLTYRR